MSQSALSATVVGIDQSIDSLNLKEFDYVEEVKIDEEKSARKLRMLASLDDATLNKEIEAWFKKNLVAKGDKLKISLAKESLKQWANDNFGSQETNMDFKGALLGMSKGGKDKLSAEELLKHMKEVILTLK